LANSENTAPVLNTTGGTGLLQIAAYLTGLGSPAEGAAVRVTDPNTGQVVGEAQTDGEGRIPLLTLDAPPLSNSQSPNQPRPFNQYNLSVTLEGYQEAAISNVQIFPSATAVQRVSLTPLYSDILIPYPTLWGDFPPKIPESEVKKLPFPENLVVLPQPVVPGLVTVHAGVPDDDTAPDYTVTFKDYIKNVASSEIYSTWPDQALRANILAIQSFTLSRVYTEWYRNKGYDFTITNSTAYDQAFTYGRNIYETISDLVDELFTTYISREDILQPLFTQYCDGDRVQRDGWLSQWGSKAQGEQGLTALQILKSYYGYDIVLKQAEKVEGIPLSFSGVLSVGSRGDGVRTIQNQLNAISNSYPLIEKVAEDGAFGEDTKKAVQTFQRIFSLPVTGAVNFPTWYAISDVYTAVKKLA
jgi:hypothetical protein